MKKQRILKIAEISILTSLSFIFYLLKFPAAVIIPIFPDFLEFQLSNLPVIIGGFVLGPIEGVIMVVIRTLLKLPLTHTIGVGEMADLVIGIATVLTSSLIYRKWHTKKGGQYALLFGAIAWVVVATLANWWFILPFYIDLLGFDAILGMLKTIPGITESNYMTKYLLIAIVPFNAMLSGVVSFIASMVYKRVSNFFKVRES
ncbi:MAG TPA: ECF transporter S component [Bacilli bacterium]|jgi:riboflavin transporter FmnP|nr:MAG: Riboflavin transporter RibU [Tenericutes bacterium ADurb.Bin140]HOE78056.1 ECF transporter S component [Bacilli bacterium]HON64435.1 ECF transporter S component [Bacilli bacterium]HOR96343.1 ECF transporter S component [Bacilli bacterium]HPK58839.1 ECF transporter S component [Bacilli bacterium]